MKKIIVLSQLLLIVVGGYAQQYPYFSQYFLNPYVYNPATIGNSGQNELNFSYRQQWMGINDAPTTQAFNFQYPTRTGLSFGVNFYNDKTVLLSNSSLTLGLAYKVPLSDVQYIKFGLSSGIGINNFDLEEVDNPNDPALHGVLDKTSYLTGQFGVHYYLKGLKLGFSLPQLYKYSAVDTVDFQTIDIDQLDNYILTASYKFALGASNLGLEPFAMYRKSEMLPTIVEAGAILDYKDVFWVGGSYRKDYGGTGYVGFNLKQNLSFGYAYEFAGGQQVSLGNGSHEFNFKVRFGKDKNQKEKKMIAKAGSNSYEEIPISEKVITKPVEVEETKGLERADAQMAPVVKSEEQAEVETVPQMEAAEELMFIEELEKEEEYRPDPNINKPKPTFSPGYYVVLGAFEIFENAVSYSSMLGKKGINTKFGYVNDRGLYYVYNLQTENFDEAMKLQSQFMQLKDFKDAWVFDVK